MTGVLAIVYRAIATHLIRKAGFTKPMAQTGAVTLVQNFSPDVWFTGKQKTERERKTKHPLAHGLVRQDFINQLRSAVGHASCPTTGAETVKRANRSG